MEGNMTGRVATEADFAKLEPLMRLNCERMQYAWDKYEASARQILANADYGFFLFVESAEQAVQGFVAFTFEWSDWRNGS